MRSTHDNSEDNPFNPDPTKDIHWGLASVDEMAFSGYGYTFDDEILDITPLLPDAKVLSDLPSVVDSTVGAAGDDD